MMKKNIYRPIIKYSPKALIKIILFLLNVILLGGFSVNIFGQIVIPLTELNPKLFENFREDQIIIKAAHNQIYFGTNNGLWAMSKDGQQITKIEGIKGNVNLLEFINDKLFVSSDVTPLITIDKNGTLTKITGAEDYRIFEIIGVGDRVFFMAGRNDLKTLSSDGSRLESVRSFSETTGEAVASGDRLFFMASNGSKDSLWSISKDGKTVEQLGIVEDVLSLHSFNNRLFFRQTAGKSLIVTEDGKQFQTIEPFTGLADGIDNLFTEDNQLFVATHDGGTFSMDEERGRQDVKAKNFTLWHLSGNDYQAEKIAVLDTDIILVKKIDETLFVTTYESFWTIKINDKKVTKIEAVKYPIVAIEVADNYLYAYGQEKIYRIDRKVKINSKLTPSGWWSNVLHYVFPTNWIPAEKTQVSAFYADENGKDPYDKNFQREFRFAKANGETVPSDEKFSTAELFNYEISLGSNSVNYWVKDKWGNAFEQKAVYYGVPTQYFLGFLPFILSAFLILGCFALAPKFGFANSAIMNPWLRKYFSLGSVPLLLSVFPSLRRYILRRYANSISGDKEFTEWKTRFVSPNEDFLPENFGKKLKDERRLLLTGQSGIGKTSFFKYLTGCYVSENKPPFPAKVFPVYISLTNYGSNSPEELVYNQLFAYGKITDKELAPMFLEQGGLIIFLDGVNEVQNVGERKKLSEFVEKYWTSNYICLSSQQSYPEIDNITKVELKTFSKEKVNEFIIERAADKEKAENVIANLTDEDYQLYSVPRDLEFAVAILNDGKDSLPRSRTQLYKTVFSAIFATWQKNNITTAENDLCQRAYTMMATRDLAFDSVDKPKYTDITSDLFQQKFLIRRENNYNFRHDLIRAFLASEYFYPIWQNLFAKLEGKQIDSNWLEMLKFSCENIENPNEVKSLIYSVMEKSIRKDLVKKLFEWLKANYPNKCKTWEKEFYAKYGELDFTSD